MHLSRRSFFASSAIIVAAASCPATSQAQGTQAVSETDPAAAANGFRTNTSAVDTNKYPSYAAGQSCSGCAFYEAEAGTAEGKCSIYGGKRVPSNGWCAAFFKRV